MRIGELAKRAGVNVQTIRFYERKQLLAPPRRRPGSDYRDYGEDAVDQMRFIQSAKEAGFTLREIGELMAMRLFPHESCDDVRTVVEQKIADIEGRMKEMRRMHRALSRLAQACRDRTSDRPCPALWEIERKILKSR